MRKIRSSLLGLLAAAVLLQSVASNAAEAAAESLRIGLVDFAPYSYYDEAGTATGLFIPLLSKMAQHAGYAADFKILPAARLVQGLQDGDVDVWLGIPDKPGLVGHTFNGTLEIGRTRVNLYYRPDTPKPRWPQDLHGKDLLLVHGYDYSPALVDAMNDPENAIRQQLAHNHAGAVGMLIRKRADYLLNYQAPMQQTLQLRPDLQIEHITLDTLPVQLIVSRHAPMGGEELLIQLESAYLELLQQGRIEELPEL
ncbi:MAG TPA: transporter substrate-binding domain-containing protein [Pseudomonas xinjiangensis]|uniref:Transporter substrate-binding domain-containing protein n=2 Tax=root TaxID=1 RepID=A0A7V1FRU4_9GAMM|nr:transporter substrate-binding domain-containing protein [Halopseudomonas xinjiangensis]HEC49103.1 transporter substrate-binding domain-containing protein [Halopseudomonas xinjiangensis]